MLPLHKEIFCQFSIPYDADPHIVLVRDLVEVDDKVIAEIPEDGAAHVDISLGPEAGVDIELDVARPTCKKVIVQPA